MAVYWLYRSVLKALGRQVARAINCVQLRILRHKWEQSRFTFIIIGMAQFKLTKRFSVIDTWETYRALLWAWYLLLKSEISIIQSYGVRKLPLGQNQPAAYFCAVLKVWMVLTLLKGCLKKQTNKEYVRETICDMQSLEYLLSGSL